jgi:L,D-peptidoglycan transpeptidase YkuD (ErfK/YbiS/YcfS/YnhG family)
MGQRGRDDGAAARPPEAAVALARVAEARIGGQENAGHALGDAHRAIIGAEPKDWLSATPRARQNGSVDLLVNSGAVAHWGARAMRCALGRSGISTGKREGDGATPAGAFALREVLYRPDRESPPRTALSCHALAPEDGWCDAPDDPAYNRLIRLPYAASAERMWRDDRLYDLVVVLGYNDDPVVPGRGSAIFLHLATKDFTPTAGCVALGRDDLLFVIANANAHSRVVVSA